MTAPRHQWLCTFLDKKERVWPEPSGVIAGGRGCFSHPREPQLWAHTCR
jgi:hypothetical protein